MKYFQVSFVVLFVLLGLASFASSVRGQGFTTVQLPTYRVFSTNSSVLVPDRGSTYIGGVNRSGSSSVRRGNGLFPTSRGYGGGTSAGGVSVSAYIHDFEAMDAAVLAEGRRRQALRQSAVGSAANVVQSSPQPIVRMSSVSGQREATRQVRSANAERARSDFEVAKRLLAKGKTAAARILLRNAYRRADESLRIEVTEQLAILDAEATKLATK